MKKALMALAVLTVVIGSIWFVIDGGQASESSYGMSTGKDVATISDLQQNPGKYLGQTVTVEGELTKECPTTGCWWYVKDKTGEIRADSLAGGFALPLNHEGKTIRTTGKVQMGEGGEMQLAATGAQLK
jgi:RecJ-like exonuclease